LHYGLFIVRREKLAAPEHIDEWLQLMHGIVRGRYVGSILVVVAVRPAVNGLAW
jgi:hypothetical protein